LFQRVGVQIVERIAAVATRIGREKEAIVEPHRRVLRVSGGDPVNRALDAPAGGRPGQRFRIVGAAELDDGSVGVFQGALALQNIRIAKADLLSRREPEELLGRQLEEVVPLDVEDA